MMMASGCNRWPSVNRDKDRRADEQEEVYLPAGPRRKPRKEDAMHPYPRKRWKMMWPHLARKA
jgi:hypothetical protein